MWLLPPQEGTETPSWKYLMVSPDFVFLTSSSYQFPLLLTFSLLASIVLGQIFPQATPEWCWCRLFLQGSWMHLVNKSCCEINPAVHGDH